MISARQLLLALRSATPNALRPLFRAHAQEVTPSPATSSQKKWASSRQVVTCLESGLTTCDYLKKSKCVCVAQEVAVAQDGAPRRNTGTHAISRFGSTRDPTVREGCALYPQRTPLQLLEKEFHLPRGDNLHGPPWLDPRRRPRGLPRPAQARVQHVAQRVTEHVETEHREEDGKAREQRDVHVVGCQLARLA